MKLIPWLAGGHEREEGGEIIPILTPSIRENEIVDMNFALKVRMTAINLKNNKKIFKEWK